MGICFAKDDNFSNININELKSFVPPVTSGRVIKVYDGDTITIASKVPGLKNSDTYKFSIRLNGIDTPEMKTKNEDEKEIAIKARDALSNKIFGKDIILKDVKTEKYGRLLCEIYFEGEHINEWLISRRFALRYNGGTKKIPKSWKDFHERNIFI